MLYFILVSCWLWFGAIFKLLILIVETGKRKIRFHLRKCLKYFCTNYLFITWQNILIIWYLCMTRRGKNPLTFSLFFNFRMMFRFSIPVNLWNTTIINFESFIAQCTHWRKLSTNYWIYPTDLTFPVFLIWCFIFTYNSAYFSWYLLFFNSF